ncbi:MAG TPA: c-type cytochrome [Casimicrobiaceae bacterium]|nr:c-type cytochrome [Casimicrobiaceae bacterium]
MNTVAVGRNENPWIWCALLYLLASLPLGARAADATVEQKAQACLACHGPQGQSSSPTLPSLDGQTSHYLVDQLRDFAAGRRQSATMTPIAKALLPEDMQALADYFSARRPMTTSDASDPAKAAHVQSVVANSLCTMCHGDGFSGQNEIPRVANQRYAYIVKALKGFRDGKRTNDGGSMRAVMEGVSDQDIEALAQYIANLN